MRFKIKVLFVFCLVLAALSFTQSSPFPSEYITFSEMEKELKAISQDHSDIAKLEIIGQSVEGRPIYALKISDFPQKEEEEPDVLYISEHHARESITVVIAMEWIRYLLNNYEKDFTIKELVDSREIWIVPMMNPDGHVRVEEGDTSWRGNAHGVDLNRNYEYKWGYDNIGSSPVAGDSAYRGPSPFSEPETRAIKYLVESHDFVTALSYHSGTTLTLYPWRYIAEHTPANDIFRAMGETIKDLTGYPYGDSKDGVIYVSNGNFLDWAYARGIMAITIEVYGKNSSNLWQYFNPPSLDIVPENIEAAYFLADMADRPERAFIYFSFYDRFKTSVPGETAEFEAIVKNNHPQTQTFMMGGPADVAFSEKSFELSPHETKIIAVRVKPEAGRKIYEIRIYSKTNPEIRNSSRLVVESGNSIPPEILNVAVEQKTDSVEVSFETNKETVATIFYGTEVPDKEADDATFSKKHSFLLENLEKGKRHVFKVLIKDASGNTKESEVLGFTTMGTPTPSPQPAKPEEETAEKEMSQPEEYSVIIIVAAALIIILTSGFLVSKAQKK
jgi:hypothetical protein